MVSISFRDVGIGAMEAYNERIFEEDMQKMKRQELINKDKRELHMYRQKKLMDKHVNPTQTTFIGNMNSQLVPRFQENGLPTLSKDQMDRWGKGESAAKYSVQYMDNVSSYILNNKDSSWIATHQDLINNLLQTAVKDFRLGPATDFILKHGDRAGESYKEYTEDAFPSITELAKKVERFPNSYSLNWFNLFTSKAQDLSTPVSRAIQKNVTNNARSDQTEKGKNTRPFQPINITRSVGQNLSDRADDQEQLVEKIPLIMSLGRISNDELTGVTGRQIGQIILKQNLFGKGFSDGVIRVPEDQHPYRFKPFNKVDEVHTIGNLILAGTGFSSPAIIKKDGVIYSRQSVGLQATDKKAVEFYQRVYQDYQKVVRLNQLLIYTGETLQILYSNKKMGKNKHFHPNLLNNIEFVRKLTTSFAPALRIFKGVISHDDITSREKNLASLWKDRDFSYEGSNRDEEDDSRNNLLRIAGLWDKHLAKLNKDTSEAGMLQYQLARQYAALQIEYIFLKAKNIQGGTGGRGVSNMDFEMVEKSIGAGTFGNLADTLSIYRKDQEYAIQDLLESFYGQQPDIIRYGGQSKVRNLAKRATRYLKVIDNLRMERRNKVIAKAVSGDDPYNIPKKFLREFLHPIT